MEVGVTYDDQTYYKRNSFSNKPLITAVASSYGGFCTRHDRDKRTDGRTDSFTLAIDENVHDIFSKTEAGQKSERFTNVLSG
jgi:hypothetical protein